MKHKFLFFLLPLSVLLLYCCGAGETEIPPGVLQKEQMIDLLVEMHKADAAKQADHSMYPDTAGLDTVNYELVFAAKNIQRAVFDSSMKFYSSHPELFDKVYDEVIMRLNLDQTELQGQKK